MLRGFDLRFGGEIDLAGISGMGSQLWRGRRKGLKAGFYLFVFFFSVKSEETFPLFSPLLLLLLLVLHRDCLVKKRVV